ncbi:hypothetical protein [Sphingomonas sp. M1A8_2b]
MKHTVLLRLTSLALIVVMGACTEDKTSYPSLGVRPIEKLGFAEPAVKAAVAAPDPALDAEIATIADKLDVIAKGFARDAAKAEAAARTARGAPVGSEGWIAAQSALAALDDWRAQSSSLVTDIESRATDRAAKLQPDYPALATIREKAQAETDREGATIARIQATLPAA